MPEPTTRAQTSKIDELRDAHDTLAELYADRLANALDGCRPTGPCSARSATCSSTLTGARRCRELPFGSFSLAGVVGWYSLMYLAPADRPRAFGELARVITPGGYLATAFKAGNDTLRRSGRTVGVEFDIYWHSPQEMERMITDAGLRVIFSAVRPADPDERQPQAYVIAQR